MAHGTDEKTTTELHPCVREEADALQGTRVGVTFFHPGGSRLAEVGESREFVVGRQAPSDVVIDTLTLSRRHARFLREGNDVYVEDLGSRNGTMVRGTRVSERTLVKPGDPVLLGSVTAVVQCTARPRRQAFDEDGPSSGESPRCSPESPVDDAFVSASGSMDALLRVLRRVATADVTVLIVGETGSGKELIASRLHRESPRRGNPFRAVNCAAIPESLLAGTLFGHERGAFTGAFRQQAGLFEEAQGGTVFLDEVAELSPSMQAALLRVIETKRVTRVGGQREVQLDVRIVAATHRDLEAMCEAGAFRSDLLFRLNTVVLPVPPLRERRDDIEAMAEHFLRSAGARWSTGVVRFDAPALLALRAYPWPGNARELKNVVERAALLSLSPAIGLEDLPEKVRLHAPNGAPLSREVPHEVSFRNQVRAFETKLIVGALKRVQGNQSRAAEALQMPLRTLVHKIRVYGIPRASASGKG